MSFPKPHQPAPVSEVIASLPDGVKVKRRVERMRACNEVNAKGKPCHGHLKRWQAFGPEVADVLGRGASEVYRCERCKTIYLPNPAEPPRTGMLSW